MRTGQARKRDANEAGIVEALEALGATVHKVSGEDVPDLFVYVRGTWFALDVKNPEGRNRLTPEQENWEGVAIVRTVDDALEALGMVSDQNIMDLGKALEGRLDSAQPCGCDPAEHYRCDRHRDVPGSIRGRDADKGR